MVPALVAMCGLTNLEAADNGSEAAVSSLYIMYLYDVLGLLPFRQPERWGAHSVVRLVKTDEVAGNA